MGYDLSNENGQSTGFNSPMWAELRWIGEKWGWKPNGTYRLKDDDAFYEENIIKIGEYFGPYTTNSGQIVTKEDALAWSLALERALIDPDFSIKLEKMHKENKAHFENTNDSANVKLTLWEFDEKYYHSTIKSFILFCKNGAFVVS